MNKPNQTGRTSRSRWLAALGLGLSVAVFIGATLWFLFDADVGLSLVLAGLFGLSFGLVVARFYGAAGALGFLIDALIAAGAAIAAILVAIASAFG